MKLLFSEFKSDYGTYIYTHVVWALPEPGETPAQLFNAGFMPASPRLDRFCLTRQVRVHLPQFRPSSENRRILRKGAGITGTLLPRAEFDFNASRRDAWLAYAAHRWGKGIMTPERLDGLMTGPVISHVLVFHETATGRELGAAVMYLEEPAMAFYYYAFYDLTWFDKNLGMFMMTWAVDSFAQRGVKHFYLGTCYSERALYKTQFAGVQFFNGRRWSTDLNELKFMIRREQQPVTTHLLNTPDYTTPFAPGGSAAWATDGFRVDLNGA
jgi:hypothetical protein